MRQDDFCGGEFFVLFCFCFLLFDGLRGFGGVVWGIDWAFFFVCLCDGGGGGYICNGRSKIFKESYIVLVGILRILPSSSRKSFDYRILRTMNKHC